MRTVRQSPPPALSFVRQGDLAPSLAREATESERRLQRLILVLWGIGAESLDMSVWISVDPTETGQSFRARVGKPGFATSAIGWACLDPVLAAEGLGLAINEFGCLTSSFEDRSEMAAVMAFFGLSWFELQQLFDPDEYGADERTHPARVVARIEKLLAERKAVPARPRGPSGRRDPNVASLFSRLRSRGGKAIGLR